MKLEFDPEKLRSRLIKILDDLVDDEIWDKSLFLKNNIKPLKDYRDELKNKYAALARAKAEQAPRHIAKQKAAQEGYIEVFIALYNSEGRDMKKWEMALSALRWQSINRPIYRNESDVQALIRTKEKQENEAYVQVYIKETEILPPMTGKPNQDRLGHELLMLREGAVRAENITHFVHASQPYLFQDNRLIKDENQN